MKTRVISGIVGALLGAIVVWQYYTAIFDIAAFAVYTIAVFEIYRTFKDGNSKIAAVLLSVVGGLIIFDRYYQTNLIAIAVAFTVLILKKSNLHLLHQVLFFQLMYCLAFIIL